MCTRLTILKDPYLTLIGPLGHFETFCGQWPHQAILKLVEQSPRRAYLEPITILGPLGRPFPSYCTNGHSVSLRASLPFPKPITANDPIESFRN